MLHTHKGRLDFSLLSLPDHAMHLQLREVGPHVTWQKTVARVQDYSKRQPVKILHFYLRTVATFDGLGCGGCGRELK